MAVNGAVILSPSDKSRKGRVHVFLRQPPVRSRPVRHDSTRKTAKARPSTYLLLLTALEAFSLVIVGGLTCHVAIALAPRDILRREN